MAKTISAIALFVSLQMGRFFHAYEFLLNHICLNFIHKNRMIVPVFICYAIGGGSTECQCLRKDTLIIMLYSILFPIFCNLILCGSCLIPRLSLGENREFELFKKMGILTIGEMLSLILLHCITRSFQGAGMHPFPKLPLFVTLLLIGIGVAFSERHTSSNKRRFIRKCAYIAGCIFLMEVFVFHVTSFSTQKDTFSLPLVSAEIDDTNAATIEGDSIRITGNCTLTFSDLSLQSNLHCLQLDADGEDPRYHVALLMKDNNFTDRFEQTGKTQATGTYSKLQFPLLPYETLYALQLEFFDVDNPITLHSGTLYSAIPFVFSTARFFLILFIALILTACKQFSVWNIRYRAKSWKHNLAVLVTMFGCIACISAFMIPNQESVPFGDNIDSNNVYAMTLDAWVNGRANLDLEVSPELLQLEDPYSPSAREGLPYHWDYAYYNGNYYCYFGCAPVALLYYPFYKITGKVLPLNTAYCIFMEVIIITMFGLIMTLVRQYCKRPPLLLLLMGLFSATVGCGAILGVTYCDRYYLCVLSGMAGLLLALWTGFAAVASKRNWKRFLLLVISGIGLVITAASRPNMLIYALLLVPIFLQLLFRKSLTLPSRMISASCFLLPVAIGAAAVMWYNQIRFDNPFQFGAVYQLTVDNVSANQISLIRLPAAIYAYFLCPMDFLNDFPFIGTKFTAFPNRAMYLFTEASFGAFAMPSILLGFLSLPLVYKTWKRKHHSFLRRITIVIAIFAAILLAWIDYCMAGISPRYMLDILVILSVLTTILLLQVPLILKSHHAGLSLISQKVIFAAMAGTVIAIFCILITCGEGSALFKAHPSLWNALKEIFVFWR